MKTISKKTLVEIVNTYKTKNQIKKMQDTIMKNYGIEKTKDFRDLVLNPIKEMIDNHINGVYNSAIDYVKDAELSLICALKRAKLSRQFIKECANIDVNLDNVRFIIERYYPYVDNCGNAAKRCIEYLKDDDGNFVTDEKGKRIVVESWFELKEITANNASSIIVTCLNKMKSIAKKEICLIDGWNIVKIGR